MLFHKFGWLNTEHLYKVLPEIFYIVYANIQRCLINITIGIDEQLGSFPDAYKPYKIVNG